MLVCGCFVSVYVVLVWVSRCGGAGFTMCGVMAEFGLLCFVTEFDQNLCCGVLTAFGQMCSCTDFVCSSVSWSLCKIFWEVFSIFFCPGETAHPQDRPSTGFPLSDCPKFRFFVLLLRPQMLWVVRSRFKYLDQPKCAFGSLGSCCASLAACKPPGLIEIPGGAQTFFLGGPREEPRPPPCGPCHPLVRGLFLGVLQGRKPRKPKRGKPERKRTLKNHKTPLSLLLPKKTLWGRTTLLR